MTYLFISPAGGILSYNNVWQKNQNVNSGDKVFSIVASQTGDIIGKIKLPVNGSGKVKSGQRVNISVTGYPYMEFGFLTGTDRKSTRLNSSHTRPSRMPSSA